MIKNDINKKEENKTKKLYLTEENLSEALKVIFNKEFVNNKVVPMSNIKKRPDFRNDELKLIIEFDGYRHYTNSKVIKRDEYKDSVYSLMGYKIIHIPYFIQLSQKVIKDIFHVDIDWKQTYPHGFIDEDVVLPADFCELGMKRFEKDLKTYWYCEKEIIESLREKIKILNCDEIVITETIKNKYFKS